MIGLDRDQDGYEVKILFDQKKGGWGKDSMDVEAVG